MRLNYKKKCITYVRIFVILDDKKYRANMLLNKRVETKENGSCFNHEMSAEK